MENEIVLPNGSILWWEDNTAGGRTYYSDEVGCGVIVWDTCLTDKSTILAALVQEETLVKREWHESNKNK